MVVPHFVKVRIVSRNIFFYVNLVLMQFLGEFLHIPS
jgi:hypothetical protein